MSECPNCGHPQPPGTAFCSYCGANLAHRRQEPVSKEPQRDPKFRLPAWLQVIEGCFLGVVFGIVAFVLGCVVAVFFLSPIVEAFVLKPVGIKDGNGFYGLGTISQGICEALFSLGLCVLAYHLIRRGKFARMQPFMQVALSIAFVIAFGGFSVCSAFGFNSVR